MRTLLELLFPRLQVLDKKQRFALYKAFNCMEPLSAREQRKLQDEIARQEKQERVAGQQRLVREGQLQKQQKVFAAAHEQVYQQYVSLMHSSKFTSTCRDSRRCSSTSSHKVAGFHIWKQRPRSTPRLTSFKIRSLTSVAFRQKARSTVSWLVCLSLRYDLQTGLCSYETACSAGICKIVPPVIPTVPSGLVRQTQREYLVASLLGAASCK